MSFDIGQLAMTAPLFTMIAAGVILLLLEAFAGGRQRGYLMPITVGFCLIAFGLEMIAWDAAESGSRSVFSGLLSVDRMSIFFDCLFLSATALTAMVAGPYMREHKFEFGEFYSIMVFATSGMMILAAATDLLTVFLGIETMSIAVYVLTGSWRRNAKSSEAAMKYFLAGAFATAVLLYGMALVYGMCGSTSLSNIAHEIPRVMADPASTPLFIIGLLMIVAALAFKVAAVPFHMWAPDTYEGAPTPVTAFMAAGIKAAAFATMIRLLGYTFNRPDVAIGASGWADLASVLAVITMIVGNVAALRQDNIKRMLAYSSIAHAGYLLIGVTALSTAGVKEAGPPLLVYLFGYTFTTLGAFAVVAWLGSKKDERLSIDDWAGLGSRHPAAALAMTVFMLSLGGVPPTAGFFGKFYLFRAALNTSALNNKASWWMTVVIVIAVLNSVVSVAYYLRVVMAMYFRESLREPKPLQSRAVSAAIVIAVVVVLGFGVLPDWLIRMASDAIPKL